MNGMSQSSYAGDIASTEAWQLLSDDPQAVLVDVRTAEEWRFVGVPELTSIGKETVFVAWQTYPGMKENEDFVAEVRQQGVTPAATVLLLCRSGNRSRKAAVALTGLGFSRCYKVADGFEGPRDENGQRGRQSGWKAAGLPWAQE
jgi:rhodanese-related sulfurtransferase